MSVDCCFLEDLEMLEESLQDMDKIIIQLSDGVTYNPGAEKSFVRKGGP
jgi:hypothetical protein